MFKNVLAVATLLLLSVNGNAQGFTHNSGSLSLSYLLQPERKFKNASGGYKYTAFAFNAKEIGRASCRERVSLVV